VATFGPLSAFAFNAVAFLPSFITYLRWRRRPAPSRLPPERLARAIVTGIKFITMSPHVRTVLLRMMVVGTASSALVALLPLVSRDLIGGGATTYGILLGGLGVGAVGGALLIGRIRRLLPGETSIRLASLVMAVAVIGIARISSLPAALPLLLLAGASTTLVAAQLNIVVQLSAPRWVTGRCLAAFTAAAAGSVAIGAILWGHIAQATDVRTALLCSGVATLFTPLLGLWLRVPTVHDNSHVQELERMPEPEVKLAITHRSGPIIVEVEYRVDSTHARDFYRLMQSIQTLRQRNGAYGWSIARDIADPDVWLERFHCPSWLDYLHQRSRMTQADQALVEQVRPFHNDDKGYRLRRFLERPYGSVRWTAEAPDLPETMGMVTP